MDKLTWEDYKDLAIACSFVEEAAVKALSTERAFQFSELGRKCVEAAAKAKLRDGE
jgi:hypothetical protein